MISAISLKKNIDFNKSFRALLEVLKLVAVSEYHVLERKLKSFDRLTELLGTFFDSVDLSQTRHPFLTPSNAPLGVLAVTSDTGLLGGLNNQVITKAAELVYSQNGKLIVVGERGQSYAQDMGLSHVYFPGIKDNERYAQACQVRDMVVERVLSGELGGFKVVYPRAHSFVVHRVEVETFVPFTPAKAVSPTSAQGAPEEIILESEPMDVVEYLVYLVMGQRLFEIFGLSRLCEQAARFLHLEESCQKIQEVNQKLLLQYFRRRHEIIDANMRELFAARSLYAD